MNITAKVDEKSLLIQDLEKFAINCLNIKFNPSEAFQTQLLGEYRNTKYKGRFGAGALTKVPWMVFLDYEQEVQKGIYPVVMFDTTKDTDNLEVAYGISETKIPQTQWPTNITKLYSNSKIGRFSKSYLRKSYTINSIDDFMTNLDEIINEINNIIEDLNFTFTNSTKIIDSLSIENLIKDYSEYKNSTEYAEQYKWDYAIKNQNLFTKQSSIENKISQLGSPNFQPYFTKMDAIKHLLKSPEIIEKSILNLFNEDTDLKDRIKTFRKTIQTSILLDKEWDNKKESDPGVVTASFLLFSNDYKKYLLFTRPRSFTKYASIIGLNDNRLSNTEDQEERYIAWQDYCITILIPKMNEVLNKENTLLDAQDFIWYVGNKQESNMPSLNEFREGILNYGVNLGTTRQNTKRYNETSGKEGYTGLYINDVRLAVQVDYIQERHKRFQVIVNIKALNDKLRQEINQTPDEHRFTKNAVYDVCNQDDVNVAKKIIEAAIYYEKNGTLLSSPSEINPAQLDKYKEYTEAEFLSEVFLDKENYGTLKNLLLNKKNIILQGAPGVGKTYAAKRLAYSILGKKNADKVKMVQFHQSYGYEDFMMGYRPKDNGFELKEGPFYDFCTEAEKNKEHKYFFIIDEINRGNLSKIFGELLMLIEKDKRGESIRLLYKEEQFSVPENVHIIGMMNTADRSLAMIDYALRRRFSFYEFTPAFETESFKEYQQEKGNEKFNNLIHIICLLNDTISSDTCLGDGFKIGHSYFCTENIIDDEFLNSVVNYEIIPLLKEYWFDEPEKVHSWIEKLKLAIQ